MVELVAPNVTKDVADCTHLSRSGLFPQSTLRRQNRTAT